jgi:superfamily II DNA/RNA helicase
VLTDPGTIFLVFSSGCGVRPETKDGNPVTTVLTRVDAPPTSFAALGVPERIVNSLNKQGITAPLPIQAATIADALAGCDVSAKAPTGSGKTLAFAVPVAARVSRGAPKRPRALVLAPTRELASQIADTMRPLLATQGLKVHAFYGGVGFGPQFNALRKGTDVAIACPGRLEDLMARGDIRLSDVDMVVIDEADRMADMGFLPCVRRILDATAPDRQTLLFSATLDGAVDVLVRDYQHEPVRHEVAINEEDLGRVTHRFDDVAHADRVERCAEIVNDEGTSIVFVRTKHGADRLAKQLSRLGVPASAIHGGRSQAQRERALAAFKAGKVQVLVATDVAARGIHVDQVTRVVHYDLPADPKDYVHRSGRTGRAGADGMVIAFVVPDQRNAARALRKALSLDAGERAAQPRGDNGNGNGKPNGNANGNARAAQGGTRSGQRSPSDRQDRDPGRPRRPRRPTEGRNDRGRNGGNGAAGNAGARGQAGSARGADSGARAQTGGARGQSDGPARNGRTADRGRPGRPGAPRPSGRPGQRTRQGRRTTGGTSRG